MTSGVSARQAALAADAVVGTPPSASQAAPPAPRAPIAWRRLSRRAGIVGVHAKPPGVVVSGGSADSPSRAPPCGGPERRLRGAWVPRPSRARDQARVGGVEAGPGDDAGGEPERGGRSGRQLDRERAGEGADAAADRGQRADRGGDLVVAVAPPGRVERDLPGMDGDVDVAVERVGRADRRRRRRARPRSARRARPVARPRSRFAPVNAATNASAGRVDELLGRAELAQLPVDDHADRSASASRVLVVVRHEQRRQAELARGARASSARTVDFVCGVERRERLVEQQHAGLARERARERDALALAAGELGRAAPRRGARSASARAARPTRASPP